MLKEPLYSEEVEDLKEMVNIVQTLDDLDQKLLMFGARTLKLRSDMEKKKSKESLKEKSSA